CPILTLFLLTFFTSMRAKVSARTVYLNAIRSPHTRPEGPCKIKLLGVFHTHSVCDTGLIRVPMALLTVFPGRDVAAFTIAISPERLETCAATAALKEFKCEGKYLVSKTIFPNQFDVNPKENRAEENCTQATLSDSTAHLTGCHSSLQPP